MSKTDAMRAMREARYARLSASRTTTASPARRPAATTPSPASTGPATASAATAATTAPDAASDTATSTDAVTGRCGHRSMNGRSCTREAGHVQKNHRYG